MCKLSKRACHTFYIFSFYKVSSVSRNHAIIIHHVLFIHGAFTEVCLYYLIFFVDWFLLSDFCCCWFLFTIGWAKTCSIFKTVYWMISPLISQLLYEWILILPICLFNPGSDLPLTLLVTFAWLQNPLWPKKNLS